MEQMSDEDVLRYAPPEIRRLWHKVAQAEAGIAGLQQQNEKILAALERIEKAVAGKS